jgi:hypothetical protein
MAAGIAMQVGYPSIDYFPVGFFGGGSGAVVLFSDSDAMVAGDALTSTNLNLVLNAFSFTGAATPEPGTFALSGGLLGLLAVIRMSKTGILSRLFRH